MILTLSPQRRDDTLTVARTGDALTLNGEAFDFSTIPDGGEIAEGIVPCAWIIGPVTRTGGRVTLTLLLPHGADASAAARFPSPIIDPPDGPVALPV